MKIIETDGSKVSLIASDLKLPTQENEELVLYVLENYSKPGDLVVDLMAGAGGIVFVADRNDREAVGIELRQEVAEAGMKRLKRARLLCADSTGDLPIEPNSCDLVFFAPPLPNLNPEKFPDTNPLLRAFRATVDIYLDNMRKIMLNSYKILKKDKYCVFTTREVTDVHGSRIDIPERLTSFGREAGYKFTEKMLHREKNSYAAVQDQAYLCVMQK